jgi:hypothetical protein
MRVPAILYFICAMVVERLFVVKFLSERRIELRRMFNCELSCYTGHIVEDCGLLMDRPKTSLVPISILPLFTTMAKRFKSTTVLDLVGLHHSSFGVRLKVLCFSTPFKRRVELIPPDTEQQEYEVTW